MCVYIMYAYIIDIYYTCAHIHNTHTYIYTITHIYVLTCRIFNSFKSIGKAANSPILQMVKRLE